MNNDQKKQVVMVVLDGWGIAQPSPGNAISLSKVNNFNRLWASYPHTVLKASGEAVGLPRDEAGNTETGHLNIGAGKIVYQDLERINMSIADGTFFENKEIKSAIEHAVTNNSSLHLLGLLGAGGVHSNIDHLFALIRYAKNCKFDRIFIHIITDGRDSPPTASQTYVSRLKDEIAREGIGQIASISGRYWAMDRDRRWDRTEKVYLALTEGKGQLVKNPEEAIKLSYQDGKTDEFIEPSIITDAAGNPVKLIGDNDSIIFFNFRIDRPRQLTAAFVVKDFQDNSLSLDFDPYMEKYESTHLPNKAGSNYQSVFKRNKLLNNLYFLAMTEYSKSLVRSGIRVAFPPERIQNPLGRVISDAGLRQLRLSESEKERFVTYYFNGQREDPFPGEDRMIIPSPNVSTYDQKPEMSSQEITDKLLERLKENEYAFVLVNFANPDMVGHTGNIGPAVIACESVDFCLGKIVNYILAFGGTLIITADHGNVEEMINLRSGQIDTEHSTNPVPFIVVSKNYLGKSQTLSSGILADLAPTILGVLGITQPATMTGRNLLEGLK